VVTSWTDVVAHYQKPWLWHRAGRGGKTRSIASLVAMAPMGHDSEEEESVN